MRIPPMNPNSPYTAYLPFISLLRSRKSPPARRSCSLSLLGPIRFCSSKKWLARQAKDPFVKKAAEGNYRARSAFKLVEMFEKEKDRKIIRPNYFVVDLGCSPGGWSQVASEKLSFTEGGRLLGIDLLEMEPVRGGKFIQGDFCSREMQLILKEEFKERDADLILSDMLTNTCGNKKTDHLRSIALCEQVLDFANSYLSKEGGFLCKVLQGSDLPLFMEKIRTDFTYVRLLKPEASRSESVEIYVFAKNRKFIV